MQPKLISSPDSGLIKNRRPWKILESAFDELEDAYCHDATTRNRWGYHLVGGTIDTAQLRFTSGKTDENGSYNDIATTIPLAMGQRIKIGDMVILITEIPEETGDPKFIVIGKNPDTTIAIGRDGRLTITNGPKEEDVGVYPALPVTGLATKEAGMINVEQYISWDTVYSYKPEGTHWNKIDNTKWTGDSKNLFWWCNHRGEKGPERYLYVTNNNPDDPIRYLDEEAKAWKDLRPFLNKNKTAKLLTCRFLVSFKDRLYAFNVWIEENGVRTHYQNRLVACQNGNPLQDNAWYMDVPGKGFYLDAPTTQSIVQSGFVNDRLIVKVDRKTYEIVYTAHPNVPVKFQLIDANKGADSTFSGVTRQNVHICIGQENVDATNGVYVEDIDDNIPREVYKIHKCCQSVERVYGILDNFSQLVYWSIPSQKNQSIYPNRILVYNYINGTWAFFNDAFTCYGKFQKKDNMIWKTVGNFYPTWSTWNAPWNAGKKQSEFPDVIAGNQQGITFIIDNQRSINAPSLIITGISGNEIICVDHTLNVGDYIGIEDAQFKDQPFKRIIVKVDRIIDNNTIVVDNTFAQEGYMGGGTIRRISKFDIVTKDFNFGVPNGKQFRVPEVHVLTDTTKCGEYIIDDIQDSAISGSTWDSVENKKVFIGTNVMRTKPEQITPNRINTEYEWHVYHSHARGAFVRFRFTLSDAQMRNWDIIANPFVLHAINFYIEPFGSIIERF